MMEDWQEKQAEYGAILAKCNSALTAMGNPTNVKKIKHKYFLNDQVTDLEQVITCVMAEARQAIERVLEAEMDGVPLPPAKKPRQKKEKPKGLQIVQIDEV